jgi:hypothetical protein
MAKEEFGDVRVIETYLAADCDWGKLPCLDQMTNCPRLQAQPGTDLLFA